MSLLFWGLTLGVIGKVLLGVAVMMVHWRIIKEHKIDKAVLTEMRKERNIAFLGIILILIGYILELVFYGYTPFGDCGFVSSEECLRVFEQL